MVCLCMHAVCVGLEGFLCVCVNTLFLPSCLATLSSLVYLRLISCSQLGPGETPLSPCLPCVWSFVCPSFTCLQKKSFCTTDVPLPVHALHASLDSHLLRSARKAVRHVIRADPPTGNSSIPCVSTSQPCVLRRALSLSLLAARQLRQC